MTAIFANNFPYKFPSKTFKSPSPSSPSSEEDVEYQPAFVNPNTLKETQLQFAPTRRQRIIEKRRIGYQLKAKTEVTKPKRKQYLILFY